MPIDQFIIFFLLLITGFFCKKYSVLTDAAINAINKFIIIIGYPCLILGRTAALDMDDRIFHNFLLSFFIAMGILFLFAGYSRLYCRGARFGGEDRVVFEFAMMSPNNGFMGFPVAFTFFGSLGLLYMIGANIALNVFFFTYGISLMNRGQKQQGEPIQKKILSGVKTIAHPGILAAFAGIIICYSGIELPGVASGYLDLVGSVTIPMAMISIGTMLAGGFGLRSFAKKLVMEAVLNRILVLPFIAAVIIWFLPIEPFVKTILIVANAMPAAAMVAIFSEQYGKNKGLAVETVVVSTLISMVTIPLSVWVLSQIGL